MLASTAVSLIVTCNAMQGSSNAMIPARFLEKFLPRSTVEMLKNMALKEEEAFEKESRQRSLGFIKDQIRKYGVIKVLQMAVKEGNGKTVTEIVRGHFTGTRYDACIDTEINALLGTASAKGHAHVVSTLLLFHANLSRDGLRQALGKATVNGHINVLEILLNDLRCANLISVETLNIVLGEIFYQHEQYLYREIDNLDTITELIKKSIEEKREQ